MRKKRFALILAACLLAQSCPYVVTAEQIENQEMTDTVVGTSEDVILSGDCSATSKDHVKWKVVKTDDDKKLKLIISGNGWMRNYLDENESLIHLIDLELADVEGMDDAYVSEVEIGKYIINIGNNAFCNSKIEKVILHAGIDTLIQFIGNNAFRNCEKLSEINIPKTVTSIGNYAFCNCKQLESIHLLSGLNLGLHAFESSGLTSIKIPNSSTISFGAFAECSNLKEVLFPEEWFGTISEHAFASCYSLKELRIPDGVETLSANVWNNCPNLNTLYLPNSLTHVDGLNDIYNEWVYGTAQIHDVYYNGTKDRWDKIFIPNEKDKEVISLGKLNIHFQEVLLAGDCSIPEDEWEYCGESHVKWKIVKTNDAKKLKLIIFGTGGMKDYSDSHYDFMHRIELKLTDLGIKDSSYISEVEICEGVTNVATNTFSNSEIEKVILPDGITSIGSSAFYGCKKLREINIPDTVTSIGHDAFNYCVQLNSITLPSGLHYFGERAFQSSGLTIVTIPKSLYCIECYGFDNCTKLRKVIFPEEWAGTIEDSAFANCENLKELRIPEGVKTLGVNIWCKCPKLKTLYLPNSLTNIQGLNDKWEYVDSPTSINNVYYNGTESAWNTIFTPNKWDKDRLASGKLKIHFQGEPTPPPAKDEPVAMQRLYHPITQEHFYTKSEHEKNVLVSRGWKYEGIGWYAPEESDTPVYRLYNPFVNDHHYTTSSYERDVLSQKYGWIDEGIGWYSDDNESVPLYRRYCPLLKSGSHHYTPALNEAQHLVKVGWKDEGIAWYGLDPDKK